MRHKLAVVKPSDMFSERFMRPFFDDWFEGVDETDLEMYEDDNNVVVKLKAPGFNKDNVEITLEDNVLAISGTVKKEEKKEDEENKTYYQRMSHQSFTRSVRLPVRVKSGEAEASFGDGVVTVTMPKAEDAKPQKVKVKTT